MVFSSVTYMLWQRWNRQSIEAVMFTLWITCSVWLLSIVPAFGQSLSEIQELFRSKHYNQAGKYLEMYLKVHPKNVKGWEMLGVSKYYIGNPKQALKFLKHVETLSPDPAYNHLFQGLSYISLKEYPLAAKYLKKSALAEKPTLNSRKASFELAVWYYNRRKVIRAKRWINHYLKHYPNGKNVKLMKQAKKNIETGVFRGNLRGIAKPDMEKSFFRNAPLSLWGSPHYWFFDAGGQYAAESGATKNNTDRVYRVVPRAEEVYTLNFNSGLGVGPYKRKGMSFLMGYHYRQRWNTTLERSIVFLADMADINYFLFRPDLLVRSHELISRLEFDVYEGITLGVFMLGEYKRSGSSFIGGPEPWSITANHLVSIKGSATPWLGYRISPRHLVKVYGYLVREVNEMSPDFSYETLHPVYYIPFAFGALYDGEFPKIDLGVRLEAYMYEYIYNDPFLDHRDMGGSGEISYSIIPALQLYLGGSYSGKAYIEKFVQSGTCDGEERQGEQRSVQLCSRSDSLWSAYGGVDFIYRENYAFFFKGTYVSYAAFNNRTDDLPRTFSFGRQEYLAGIKIAFPSVKKVRRFENLHSDKPFVESIRQ